MALLTDWFWLDVTLSCALYPLLCVLVRQPIESFSLILVPMMKLLNLLKRSIVMSIITQEKSSLKTFAPTCSRNMNLKAKPSFFQ